MPIDENAWVNREGREGREVGNKIGPKRANRFFLRALRGIKFR
jgi:hypothetical protein